MKPSLWLLTLPMLVLIAQPVSADEEWDRLEAEYDEAFDQWVEKMEAANPGGMKIALTPDASLPPHPADQFRPKIRKYAEKNEAKPAALPALAWLVTNEFGFPSLTPADGAAKWALDRLKRNHATDPAIKDHIGEFSYAAMSVGQEPLVSFLETVAEKNPDREAKGQARLTMGQVLYEELPLMMMGMGGGQDRAKQKKRAEKIFRSLSKEYAGSEIGKQADGYLFAIDRLQVGMKAPDIVGKDVDGNEISLAQFRDKVTMIVFWATWCTPCMQMIPHERELMETHADQPFIILGINIDESRSVCRDAIKKEKITWPNIFDGPPDKSAITKEWHIRSFPTILLLDHKGVIRHKDLLPFQVGGAVNELLAEVAAAKKD